MFGSSREVPYWITRIRDRNTRHSTPPKFTGNHAFAATNTHGFPGIISSTYDININPTVSELLIIRVTLFHQVDPVFYLYQFFTTVPVPTEFQVLMVYFREYLIDKWMRTGGNLWTSP
jgi:hypothetical protein